MGQHDAALHSMTLARDICDWLADQHVPGALASRITCLVQLGQIADRLNRTDEALRAFDQATQSYESRRHEPSANKKKALQGQAMCRHVIGRKLMDQGHNEAAASSLRAAMEVRQAIVRDFPATEKDREDLDGMRARLAEVERRLNTHRADQVPDASTLAPRQRP
jgi:hypothetical protein